MKHQPIFYVSIKLLGENKGRGNGTTQCPFRQDRVRENTFLNRLTPMNTNAGEEAATNGTTDDVWCVMALWVMRFL